MNFKQKLTGEVVNVVGLDCVLHHLLAKAEELVIRVSLAISFKAESAATDDVHSQSLIVPKIH